MKHLLITLLLLAFSTTLLADKFVVKSFKRIDNKIMLNKDKRTDDNDELCAIVLVRTSLTDLGISASTPVADNINWRQGDYWVYLSAGTRMIKFFKKGFETLEYTFPQRIEKGKFYVLQLEYRRTNAVAAVNTMGFVVINSNPSGAEVLINGEATGLKTPFQNPYNEGYYRFTLKKPFYDNYTGDFTIVSGKTQQKNINLVPNYGSLKLEFTPATAVSVSIDGNPTEQNSPYFIEKLKPGNHTLLLSKATYDDYKQNFTINKGQTTTLTINITPDFGNFTVKTDPEVHANVSIDGNPYSGTTPFSKEKLLPGKHTLRLTKKMYLTYEQEFTINKGERTTITAKMQPNFANLTITAVPGDSIIIDRQEKGIGTYNGRLLRGIHIIEIRHANYYPQSRQITIVPGHDLTETFTLKPKTGILSVMTTPIGATVYLNGVNKGQSPLFVNKLITGTYALRLQKQGYATLEKQVAITENKTTSIKETLLSTVSVKISSSPEGAKLYVDGQYKGITPVTISLSPEQHSFKLQKKNYHNFETNRPPIQMTNSFNFELQAIHPAVYTSSVAGIEMVFVKGGTFQMGNPSRKGDYNEHPQHTVTVNDFYIGKYEVTVAQFKKFIDATNYVTSAKKQGGGYIWTGSWMRKYGVNWKCDVNGYKRFKNEYNHPVIYISWVDAVAFCKWLSKKTGKHYRLPTEAEWEYAARGGNNSKGYKYSGSNKIDNVAWSSRNSRAHTHPVGTKAPNELGIYDMSGNVWEWCSDWYDSNYYSESPQDNPQGPSSGEYKVLRGGSWYSCMNACHVTFRYKFFIHRSVYINGFRIVHPVQQ